MIRSGLGLALCAVVLFAAACGSGDGGSSSTSAADTTSATATETTDTATTETVAAPKKPKGDPEVNKNTRAFLNTMAACETAVGLVLLEIKRGKSDDVELADLTTQARDVCEGVRSKLATMDTDHFDDQAAIGFYAADRYKSGLNAMLAYIDNPRPTKIVEARDKLREGDQSAAEALHEINVRRHVYHLKAIHQ